MTPNGITLRVLTALLSATVLSGCGPATRNHEVDPCRSLEGLQLTRVNNFEGTSTAPWKWARGDRSEGHVAELQGPEAVPPDAPKCEPVDGQLITGEKALTIVSRGSNFWGSATGGPDLAPAQSAGSIVRNGRAAGTDGLAFWAKAEGSTGLKISLHTWPTNNAVIPPKEIELDESNAIALGPERRFAACANWWRENWDKNDNGKPDEGERGDDITGDGVPERREDIPIEWQCGDHFTGIVTFPQEWSLVKVPFSSLRQRANGRMWPTFDERSLGQLVMNFPGTADVVLRIDWFGFYTAPDSGDDVDVAEEP